MLASRAACERLVRDAETCEAELAHPLPPGTRSCSTEEEVRGAGRSALPPTLLRRLSPSAGATASLRRSQGAGFALAGSFLLNTVFRSPLPAGQTRCAAARPARGPHGPPGAQEPLGAQLVLRSVLGGRWQCPHAPGSALLLGSCAEARPLLAARRGPAACLFKLVSIGICQDHGNILYLT